MPRSRIASFGFLIGAFIAAGAMLLERQRTALLRDQVHLLRGDEQELSKLRSENARLRARQPSEAELAALRSDDAAATKLRQELNALRGQITTAERSLPRDQP